MQNPSSRRDFVREATVAASVAALADQIIAQTSSASATGIPTRVLGRTSQRVSIVALGGWHIGVLKDEDEAVRIANGTVYGLAAGVWTTSIRRAITMSERLEAGTVWVNTYRVTSYMSPFGGYKRSGIGRESGIDAVREYLQTKSVWIDISGNTPNPFVHR